PGFERSAGPSWASAETELSCEERLRIAFGSSALHAPESRQTEKGLPVEPLLGPLRREVRHEQFDLALQNTGRNRHVKVGLAKVSIPLGDLVLEDAMIAERIPGQPARLPMILVRVGSRVGQDEIGIRAAFQRLEPALDLVTLLREEPVLKGQHLDLRV